MRNIIFLLFTCLSAIAVSGQDFEAVQLQQQLNQHTQQDTARVNLLNALARNTSQAAGKQDTIATEALALSRKTHYAIGEAYALLTLSSAKLRQGNRQEAVLLVQQADSIANATGHQELPISVLLTKSSINSRGSNNQQALSDAKEAESKALKTSNKRLLSICQIRIASLYGTSFTNYPEAIEYGLKAVRSGEEADCLTCLASNWAQLGAFYNNVGDQNTALMYYKKAADANKKLGDQSREMTLNNSIGERYRLMGKYREAIPYYNNALALSKDPYNIELTKSNLADVYTNLNNLPLAFTYAFTSLATARQIEDNEGIAWIDAILARIYLQKDMVDSTLYYAKEGLAMARQTGTLEYIRDNAGALAKAYALKRNFEQAYTYNLIYFNYRDSMMNSEISNKSAVLQYNYDLAQKQAQITTLDQQRKVQRNFLVSALIVLALIGIMAVVLLRNNRQKQKANQLLRKQKLELQDQRDQTNKALAELQQAQKQLVQAEKMASLGELTAGIAHEIQNPLNFVNNFSEVNNELIEEINQETNVVEIKTIANDIRQNNEKIAFHGKRADAIVKNMLQHSHSSKGEKQLTDINTLCDEYLRLSYHGLRAKDKSFNAALKTDFDDSIGKIQVVPQDIGRVLLNLFNNAFYAVNEKKKQQTEGYEPTVSVSTKRMADKIKIVVRDNGMGISKSLVDKIFQPFFTTKPSGVGTGLGLSLSYDIIKAHGGQLIVDSAEKNGTSFIINLPA